MLTKDNVEVLGGDVVELYGGDMIAELEDRFKRKLGIIEEPITPVPTENGSSNPGANSTATPSHNNSNHAMPAQNPMQAEPTDNFDDDINYDDLPMDSFETDMGSSEAANSAGRELNTTLPDTTDTGYSDDDDFMEPPPPPPPHASPRPPSTNTTSRVSLEKRPQQTQESTISSKRTRVEASSPVAEVPASTTPAPPEHDQNVIEPTPMDTDEDYDDDDQGDLSFVDPSVWANFEMAVNNDKVQYDDQGRANCSFDALKQILIAMREQTGGNVPDTLRVKAQCIKMAKLKMHINQCFYLELLLGDPIVKYEKNGPLEGTIRAVVNNEVRWATIGIYDAAN